jgi:POT family proton-dependent oligopeptide transporter
MGINIGAMLGPIVCEILQPNYGYERAFNAAALGMVISVAILVLFRRDVEDSQQKPADAASAAAGGASAMAVAAAPRHPIEDVPAMSRVIGLVAIFIVGIAFWMVFWQNNSTIALWAKDNTDWTLFTDRPVAGMIQASINPAFIILFGIPVTALWKWLDARRLEPSTPTKMCLGLLFAAAASAVLWGAASAGGDTGRVSCLWLIGSYAFISLGELFLSAMGLSLVSKVAPPRYRGLLMGGWFLSLSLGGKFSGEVGVYWTQWAHSTFFAFLTALSLGAAAVLFVLLRFLRKCMPGV